MLRLSTLVTYDLAMARDSRILLFFRNAVFTSEIFIGEFNDAFGTLVKLFYEYYQILRHDAVDPSDA